MRSPCITTGRRPAPRRPPCSTTRTSSTRRPRPGPSGTSSRDSRGTGARRSGALGHRRLLRRPRDAAALGADGPVLVPARRPAGTRRLDRRERRRTTRRGAVVRRRRGNRGGDRARLPLPRPRNRRDGHRGADLRDIADRAARGVRAPRRLADGAAVGRDRVGPRWDRARLPRAAGRGRRRGRTRGGRGRTGPRRGTRLRAVRRRPRRGGAGERPVGDRHRAAQLRHCARPCARVDAHRPACLAAPAPARVGRRRVRHRRERVDRGRDDTRLDRNRGGAQLRSIRS